MSKCRECDGLVEASHRFCESCGARVVPATEVPAAGVPALAEGLSLPHSDLSVLSSPPGTVPDVTSPASWGVEDAATELKKRMVGEKAMVALGSNRFFGSELGRFVPVHHADQVAAWVSNSIPQATVLAVEEGRVVPRQPNSSRSKQPSTVVEAILALENLLSLRNVAAPSTTADNARAWVRWSQRFLKYKWESVVSAFEHTRFLCELENSWDWNKEFPEAREMLRQPSREAVTVPGAPRSRERKQELDKDAFEDLLKQCRPVSACAKFQLGSCSKGGDHGRPDDLRRHVCCRCSSPDHGSSSCTAPARDSGSAAPPAKKQKRSAAA